MAGAGNGAITALFIVARRGRAVPDQQRWARMVCGRTPIILVMLAGFCLADDATNSAVKSGTTLTNHQNAIRVSEAASETDTQLGIPLGLWKRQLAISYASSLKLTVTCRVYRSGVLDRGISSRQVHGTSLPTGTESLQLGVVDPDATNPGRSQGKVKIFGSLGPLWIDKPSQSSSSGCEILIPKTGELEVGKEQLVMELRYGTSILIGSSATYVPTNSAFRVTLHVRADPLTAEERQTLVRQSNFNEAHRVDD